MSVTVKIPVNRGYWAASLLNCSMRGRYCPRILWRHLHSIQAFRGFGCCRAGFVNKLPLSIAVVGQEPIEGPLIWQDPEFLAIERAGASRPVLINRRQISMIRSLG